MQRLLDRVFHRSDLRRLEKQRAALEEASLDDVQTIERRARQVGKAAASLQRAASLRLRDDLQPDVPQGTTWFERASAWTAPLQRQSWCPVASSTPLGPGLTVHHDANVADISLRQDHASAAGSAPFAISIDLLDFDGSYLSLALALPSEVAQSLTKGDLIRLSMSAQIERDAPVFGRLNLKQGPNTETIVREIEVSRRDAWVEFDLYYLEFEREQISDAWLDVIFEAPAMNRILINDLYVSRRPRAGI